MLMLLREDRRSRFGEDFSGLKKLKQTNPKAKDPFFEKNFNHGRQQFSRNENPDFPSTYEKVDWQ